MARSRCRVGWCEFSARLFRGAATSRLPSADAPVRRHAPHIGIIMGQVERRTGIRRSIPGSCSPPPPTRRCHQPNWYASRARWKKWPEPASAVPYAWPWPGAGRSGGARADDRGVTQTSKVQKFGTYPKRSLRSLAVSSTGPTLAVLSPTRRSGGRQSYRSDIIRAARAASGNSPGSTPIRNRTAPQLCARASCKAPSSRRNITSRAFALRAMSPQSRLRKPRRLS